MLAILRIFTLVWGGQGASQDMSEPEANLVLLQWQTWAKSQCNPA